MNTNLMMVEYLSTSDAHVAEQEMILIHSKRVNLEAAYHSISRVTLSGTDS